MVVGVKALQRINLVAQSDASFGISKENMIATARSTRNVDCLRPDRIESFSPGGSTDCSLDPMTEQCESSRMRTGSTVHTLLLIKDGMVRNTSVSLWESHSKQTESRNIYAKRSRFAMMVERTIRGLSIRQLIAPLFRHCLRSIRD